MRLLVDQGFPASIAQSGSMNVELLRWNTAAISDEELLKEAQLQAWSGVVFLGTRSLLSSSLRDDAANRRLWLAGTVTTNPFEAMRSISNNIGAIERSVKSGDVHLIYAREVRPLED
ncbi:hypothetical protein [Aeromicrobium fastidiosum]|uniref:VapC45 PIN like domain-containing protein n=1 Tax=Aeromicrobium fastidiosum TaxID=52699 RepID=A0A641AJI5_9ACTN|nr:hypothetical protein [Aeromicrobium fastidiosum]KAA1375975.1 hypothetical protein ESP62_010960 [Aeromicrobium fastidiosum]MBP2392165.1 hypothetical protein [Aeromicrobium fastidiosum]